jgi:hypothetical protein
VKHAEGHTHKKKRTHNLKLIENGNGEEWERGVYDAGTFLFLVLLFFAFPLSSLFVN